MSQPVSRGKEATPTSSQKVANENLNFNQVPNRERQASASRQQPSMNHNADPKKDSSLPEEENGRLHNECENLKKQLEAVKNAKADQIKLLLNEIERLTLALNTSNQEIFSLREKNPTHDPREGRQKASSHYAISPEPAERINMLAAECEKLSALLKVQEDENETLRRDNNMLATENEELKASIFNLQALNDKINNIENKCRELIDENDQLNVQLSSFAKDKNIELKNRGTPLDDERIRGRSQGRAMRDEGNKAQNDKINQLLAENDKLNKTLDILQKDHLALSDLVRQIPRLAEENDKLQKVLSQAYNENRAAHTTEEVEALKSQLNESTRKLAENDAKLRAFTTDYNQIESSLKAAIAENGDLRKSLHELQRLGNIASGLGDTVEKAKHENEGLKRAVEAKVKETELAKSEIAVLRDTVFRQDHELENQNERLKQATSDYSKTKNELDKLRAESNKLGLDLEKMNHLFAESQANSSKLHSQLTQAQKENIRLKEDNSQLKKVFDDANSLRPRLEDMGRIIQQLQKEIDRLNDIIAQKTREHTNLKEKQAYLLEQTTKNEQNLREIERLAALLNAKSHENALLSAEVNDLARKLEKARELEELNRKMQKDNEVMFKKMKELKKELTQKTQGSSSKPDGILRKEEELRQKEAELNLKEQELQKRAENINRGDTFRSKSQVIISSPLAG